MAGLSWRSGDQGYWALEAYAPMKWSPRPYCFGTKVERRAYHTAVMALMVARREACAGLLAGLSYEESGFAGLEGKVMLPNELQALRCAKARAVGEQSAGD